MENDYKKIKFSVTVLSYFNMNTKTGLSNFERKKLYIREVLIYPC